MTEKRLVDPVHFFDRLGNSMVSYEHLRTENFRLTGEVDRLRKLLKAQVDKNRGAAEEQPRILN